MKVWLSALCFCLLFAVSASAQDEKGSDEVSRQTGRVRAPELEGGRGWLNTDAPLSLAALRGKVVLLDFWTYGCVNCMHVIPDLKRLEEKYQKQLVVIGVHSAKFENEKETENIRRIVLRYGIEHPVVNDADFRIWHSYAVQAWPTLVLIDPAGYVVGKASGEGHYDVLDKAVGELVEDARKRGTLNEQPLKLALERAKVGDLPLAFPGKILADAQGERLFIADTNHNRVVVARLDGTLLYTIGSGARGSSDGNFDKASFHHPQGLALDNETLYVADTENHLIRRVDLKARSVETVAGTGQQSRDYSVGAGGARMISLSSPWDLQLVGRSLYIAMAGPHQIWRLDLTMREVSVFAGTGREARNDGRRLGDFADESVATFAQPSGLAGDGKTLYVADAESNIIRAVALEGDAKAEGVKSEDAKMKTASLSSIVEEVRTLAGGDLFEFGDRDGEGDDVRLQHPLGLALDGARLFIADTYNHKIKTLDPRTRKVTTFVGAGRPGQADGERASFYEPGGLSVARGKLYVADTNNHAVRVVDLSTKRTTTLVIRGLQPPAQPDMKPDEYMATVSAGPNASEADAPAQRLAVGDGGALVIDVELPAGHHLNTAAPNRYKVFTEEGRYYITFGKPGNVPANATPAHPVGVSDTAKDMRLPLRIDLRGLEPGHVSLRVEVTLYYCREDDTGVCRVKTLLWRVPVEVTDAAGVPREIVLRAKVE
ncbi:MAG TPA: thioredoxin-like domain-containing protein [Pyrinomonadaceae bacterium]|jgi:thiol-disulfide isomerase/thioredoxin|nr:thioredoxin-like domain-containing protein [Pyrinomonadaceae bacterium]